MPALFYGKTKFMLAGLK